MSEWKYSGGIDRYKVLAGDIWIVGERHVFVCGDLDGKSRIDEVINQYKPQLVYTDPPWTNSLATGFRTKSGVDGAKGKKVNVESLIKTVLSYAKRLSVPCFIEGGMSVIDMNKDAIVSTGGTLHNSWKITYGKNLDCMLYFADYRGNPVNDFPDDLSGMDDIQTPYPVINHYKPNYVLDPCGGRGTTAVMAETAGCGSILHELSPYRMADAIMHMADIFSMKPQLASRI